GRLAGVLESIDAQRTFHYVILDYFARVRGGVLRPGDDATDARWVRLDEIGTMRTTPRLVEFLTKFGVLHRENRKR
ncbi:MAG: NUDIX hydrolase, partial [Actinomycetota bacterium]|nr:NUDIX hydrolase [Actinomycetota bacterium]